MCTFKLIIEALRRNHLGDRSFFPFVAMWLAASMWTIYGLAIWAIVPLALCNIFGFFCASYYCAVFIGLAKPAVQREASRKMLCAIAIVTMVCIYLTMHWKPYSNREYALKRVGELASFATVSQFASPLIVVLDVIRTKSSALLSFPLTVCSLMCSCLWLAYGAFILEDINVIVPNILGFIAAVLQLMLFMKYPRRKVEDNRIFEGDTELLTVIS